MRDLPGVDPDGKNPGGLEVAGNVEAHTITRDGVTVGAPYPGVTSDGLVPGGVVIDGAVTAGDPNAADVPTFHKLFGAVTIQDVLGTLVDSDVLVQILQTHDLDSNSFPNQALLVYRGGDISTLDYSSEAVDIADGTASARDLVRISKGSGTGHALNVVGPALFSEVIGEGGKPPAPSPTAISGTITAATLTQLTAIVLELLQALDAKGSIVNSTT